MQVLARPELQCLTDRVQAELEAAIQERTDLGLSTPSDFETHITFYNAQGGKAQAYITEDTSVMSINAAPAAVNYLKEEDNIRLRQVMQYFDIVRDFLGNQHEDVIFATIQNPKEHIQRLEDASEALEAYKEFLEDRGTSYQEYKDYTINNAQFVNQTIQDLLPKIETAFATADLSSIRHELDHIDFFDSPQYRYYHALFVQTDALRHLIHTDEGSKHYAAANMECLGETAQIIPLLEVRAFFFNCIDPDQWKTVDFDHVKGKVFDHFTQGYVEGALLEQIVEPLVSVAWSEKQMNRQTSNYIFQKVNEQRNSPNAARYVVDPDPVNQELADRILEVELPQWKKTFTTNSKKAVEAIGDAYKNNPARLSIANQAQTFDEYIAMCRGKP